MFNEHDYAKQVDGKKNGSNMTMFEIRTKYVFSV